MRHLGSIVLSVISAVIIYVLAGVGMIRLAINGGLVAQHLDTNWTDVGIGVGAVVVAGALYAVLTMARLSPLGPVIASLLYIIVQLWALFDQSNVTSTLGTSVFGTQGAAEAPLTGLTLLLAVPLLATIFSPRRWKGKDKPAAVGIYAPPAGQAAYAQPGVPQPGVPQAYPPVAPQPTYAQPEPAQQSYVQPEAQTYAAPPAAQTYAQPTYTQPAYPQPTSAAPAYNQSLPEPVAPHQTTADNAGDAQAADRTVIENRPDATNQ